MHRDMKWAACLVAIGVAAGGSLAFAEQALPGNDATADLAKAKVTLVQAILSAEASAGGRATRAELESENGSLVVAVEVATAQGKVFDVVVDAVNGRIKSSREDQADRRHRDDDHK